MKLFKLLLRVLLLLPALSVTLWHFATPDQRANHLPWVHNIVKAIGGGHVPEYFQLPIRYSYRQGPSDSSVSSDLLGTKEVSISDHSSSFAGHGFVRYHCIKPETSEITLQERVIYQWEDALGKSHMGDKPPPSEDVRELRRVSMRTESAFKLDINEEQAVLPVFARDRFQSEINQIYDILRKDWGLSNLRKTHINLRLIDDIALYQEYQARLAPNLGASSGFYNPRLNEAVIHTAGYAPRTYRITRHEATHAILAGLYGQLPTWFNEGLAEYFTGMELTGQSKVIQVAKHYIETLEAARSAQRLPDLRTFFDVSSNVWYQDVNKSDRYAMSWSLVFFLLSEDENRAVFIKLMQTLGEDFCNPIDSAAFFDTHYPGSLTALQDNWMSWLFSQKYYDQRY